MNLRIAIIFALLPLLCAGGCSRIRDEYSRGGAAGAAIRELGTVDVGAPVDN